LDPDSPKRNVSAYMFLCYEKRNEVIASNPGVNFGEIGKILGETWKALDSDKKKKYESLAYKDKERYANELDAYKKDTDEEI